MSGGLSGSLSGKLFIVSGPSGAGKSSLCGALLQQCPDLKLSVSCTTRTARPGEMDGCAYHFINAADFEQQRDHGAFLEWALVHGNLYGTRQSDVQAMLENGNVLLEIDWQGAQQVAEKIPAAVRIFILPPSLDELSKRLTARGQDDEAIVNRRVAAAEAEMSHADEAHYQVINDDFDATLQKLLKIFTTKA